MSTVIDVYGEVHTGTYGSVFAVMQAIHTDEITFQPSINPMFTYALDSAPMIQAKSRIDPAVAGTLESAR